MDHIDEAILSCLHRNARMSASRISEEVNLSVSSVLERIRRMEKSGIILRYTTVVDYTQIGQAISFVMGVSMEKSRDHEGFKAAIIEEPAVQRCDYVTGPYDYLLWLSVTSHNQLKELHQQISTMQGVANVSSFLVLDTIKGS